MVGTAASNYRRDEAVRAVLGRPRLPGPGELGGDRCPEGQRSDRHRNGHRPSNAQGARRCVSSADRCWCTNRHSAAVSRVGYGMRPAVRMGDRADRVHEHRVQTPRTRRDLAPARSEGITPSAEGLTLADGIRAVIVAQALRMSPRPVPGGAAPVAPDAPAPHVLRARVSTGSRHATRRGSSPRRGARRPVAGGTPRTATTMTTTTTVSNPREPLATTAGGSCYEPIYVGRQADWLPKRHPAGVQSVRCQTRS